MILTVSSLLEENPQPTREEIRAHLRGNLCRCTGYWNIFEAIETAVEQQEGGSE
jgi:carbon-monoxide dehydrogenase small subunit